MTILVLSEPPTPVQMRELLEWQKGGFVKLAVDIAAGVLAAGGEWPADSEKALLNHGSEQSDIWGADWVPSTRTVRFESLINFAVEQNQSRNDRPKSFRS